MIEDTGVGRAYVRLEAAVERADLSPVRVERLNVVVANPGAQVALLKRAADGTHGRLVRKTRHAYTTFG